MLGLAPFSANSPQTQTQAVLSSRLSTRQVLPMGYTPLPLSRSPSSASLSVVNAPCSPAPAGPSGRPLSAVGFTSPPAQHARIGLAAQQTRTAAVASSVPGGAPAPAPASVTLASLAQSVLAQRRRVAEATPLQGNAASVSMRPLSTRTLSPSPSTHMLSRQAARTRSLDTYGVSVTQWPANPMTDATQSRIARAGQHVPQTFATKVDNIPAVPLSSSNTMPAQFVPAARFTPQLPSGKDARAATVVRDTRQASGLSSSHSAGLLSPQPSSPVLPPPISTGRPAKVLGSFPQPPFNPMLRSRNPAGSLSPQILKPSLSAAPLPSASLSYARPVTASRNVSPPIKAVSPSLSAKAAEVLPYPRVVRTTESSENGENGRIVKPTALLPVSSPAPTKSTGSSAQPPVPSAVPNDNIGRHRECALRIFAVNDVYVLDNFPRLKTLISTESAGCKNVVTTMAGDFLAPSLLSSLDCGLGTIKVMNQIPFDFACFGNHEADIPYAQLVHRIEEFNGQWLNTNMPDFKPTLPSSFTKKLVGEDGNEGARTVSFLGLLIGGGKFKATYREGAFGGAAATMVPVVEAAKIAYGELVLEDPELDAVIPITHQDMAEDLELADMGVFPVVLAGHDHDVAIEMRGDSTVVKGGMDVQGVAVIDIIWGQGASAKPSVTVNMKDVANYEADPVLSDMIEKIHQPVRELEAAMLYELDSEEKLSSVGVKFNKNDSMARLVATAIREVLECDAATINAGAVRGKKDYFDGVSYGDLKKECPYPSPLVVVPMPFAVLRDAVRWSRKPWWDVPDGEEAREGTGALHPDTNLTIDSNHWLTAIGGEAPDENRLYTVACDTRVCKKNEVFRDYCAAFPERIPPDDAGRPVLPILVDYFCGMMWDKLFMSVAAETDDCLDEDEKIHRMFDTFDADHNGQLDPQELRDAIRSKVGENLCSNVVVEQMITIIDADGNGLVSEAELRQEIRKIHHLQRVL